MVIALCGSTSIEEPGDTQPSIRQEEDAQYKAYPNIYSLYGSKQLVASKIPRSVWENVFFQFQQKTGYGERL